MAMTVTSDVITSTMTPLTSTTVSQSGIAPYNSSTLTDATTDCVKIFSATPINVTMTTATTSSSEPSFFDTYYSPYRFAVETTLAAVATASNAVILGGVRRARGGRRRGTGGSDQQTSTSAYNLLFANLTGVNVLSSGLSWLSNNLLYLFVEYFTEMSRENSCRFVAHILGGVVIANALGIVSALTTVGFPAVQYAAICIPFRRTAMLLRRKVLIYITTCWAVSALGALGPLVCIAVMTSRQPCDQWLYDVNVNVITLCVNVCAALCLALYAINAALCVCIYRKIRSVRREMTSQLRFGPCDMRVERRAFITIVTLLVTANAFFLPYLIVHVLSLNGYADWLLSNRVVIYVMNSLPYLKYASDPVIYGLRMREMNDCWMASTSLCCGRSGTCMGRRRRSTDHSRHLMCSSGGGGGGGGGGASGGGINGGRQRKIFRDSSSFSFPMTSYNNIMCNNPRVVAGCGGMRGSAASGHASAAGGSSGSGGPRSYEGVRTRVDYVTV